ncbi:MAG: trypsin-like peptidase domain-containing protein, partial [Lachnospiraceae bacterium]|nr:trypsin-like peptidase domain-containing protein [Lachnospiraceae bacterium]
LQEVQMMFSFETRLFESESEGSGIIVSQNDDELLILTNNHVVDGAQTLTVQFFDDEAYEAQVKGTDPSMDVAVIAVPLSDLKSSTKDAIKIALIGDSDKLEIGEQVVAIGNALGYGQSVTTGIISALNRDIDMSNLDNSLIQTDAAINPGNSGGALLNMRGEVIGINSAKLSDMTVEGMCYAIPISKALPVAEQLMNRENRDKVEEDEMGYMGIKGVLVTEDQAELYSMPEGIYLQEIVEDSPAEEAGLQVGDIIEKFDGLRISTYAELQKQMQYYRAGETVELEIYRLSDGRYEEQTISITLGKRMEQN